MWEEKNKLSGMFWTLQLPGVETSSEDVWASSSCDTVHSIDSLCFALLKMSYFLPCLL